MIALHNPSLREETLTQKVGIIPPREQESLLNWLEESGRFAPYEPNDSNYSPLDEDELEAIMETTSPNGFEDDEDESDQED